MLEEIITILALLFFGTGGFSFLFGTSEDLSASELGRALILQQGVYALIFICLLRCWKQLVAAGARLWFLFALIALATLSADWSPFPGFTIRRSIVLFATTLFGVYFGIRFRLEKQLTLLAISLGIITLGSLFCILLFPAYGISSDPLHIGDWQGLFDTKNGLAKVMSLSFLTFVLLPVKYSSVRFAGIVLSAGMLLESGSRTGIMVSSALILVYAACQRRPRRGALLAYAVVTLTVAAGCVAYWFGLNAQTIGAVIDRDTTLTGRDDIWAVVMILIMRRPWLGYGFSTVWLPNSETSVFISRQLGWAPPHAHNGFLDLALDLGFVGLAVFVAGFLKCFSRGLAVAVRRNNDVGLWPLMYLCFLSLYNLTESSLLKTNSLYWSLYVSVAASVITEYSLYRTDDRPPFPAERSTVLFHGKVGIAR